MTGKTDTARKEGTFDGPQYLNIGPVAPQNDAAGSGGSEESVRELHSLAIKQLYALSIRL
ncbi:hypothetical protein CO650_25060 [Rhizobium phaseoli]|nr:hypothetical protein CO650_25060 [Rhizobium phaseoli]